MNFIFLSLFFGFLRLPVTFRSALKMAEIRRMACESRRVQRFYFVGEMSFIDGSPRSASVMAATNATLIEVPAKNLDDAIRKSPPMAVALIKTVSGRVRNLNSQVSELQAKLKQKDAA